jgi:hypothetical protein
LAPPEVHAPTLEEYRQRIEKYEKTPEVATVNKFRVKRITKAMEEEYAKRGRTKLGSPGQQKKYSLFGLPVKYLNEDELKEYEVRIVKDKGRNVFVWKNQIVDTKEFSQNLGFQGVAKGRAIFVLSATGKSYMANQSEEIKTRKMRFHHSSFMAGEPVAMAGELWFENGTLKGISDTSGHYFEDVRGDIFMIQTLQHLQKLGVDLENADVEIFHFKGLGPCKAGALLRYVAKYPGGVQYFVTHKFTPEEFAAIQKEQ